MEDDNVLSSTTDTAKPVRISTRRVHQAEDLGGTVYHPHEVRKLRASESFGMELNAATFSGITIGLLQYASPVVITSPTPRGDFYQVNFTAFGAIRMGTGRTEGEIAPTSAVLQDWTTPTIIRGWGDPAKMIGLRIPRTLIEDSAVTLHGSSPEQGLRLKHQINLEIGAGSSFANLVRALARDLDQVASTLANPLVGAPLAESLVRLLTLAATEQQQLVPAPAAGPLIVARAVEYMEAYAHRPLTVSDIAQAVNVSTRSLQQGFRQHRGSTPMATLREIRLIAARTQLEKATAQDSIAEVAANWGFSNPGRFAVQFAQRFGMRPSEVRPTRAN